MINEKFHSNAKYDFDKSFERHADILTAKDVELIKKYLADKKSVDHISDVRVNKIACTLVGWRRFIKPFGELTIQDVKDGIERMKSGRATRFTRTGEEYEANPLKPATQYDFVVILKPFLLWLQQKRVIKIKKSDIQEQINPPSAKDSEGEINPEDLLTVDEVDQLIQAAHTERDRALISVLYESGCRVAEAGRLAWKDLVFDDYGVKVRIQDTKEEKRRYARLTKSTKYLAALQGLDSEGFVFKNPDGTPMTYIGMKRVLERAGNKADVKKRLTPHMLRHARATAMINDNINPVIIKKTLWNNLNSTMFNRYVSLGEKDIDKAILEQQGIKPVEKKDEGPRSWMCGVCHAHNEAKVKFCWQCGNARDKKAADRQKLVTEQAEMQPEYKQVVELFKAVPPEKIAEFMRQYQQAQKTN